jgi:hypothetical protein
VAVLEAVADATGGPTAQRPQVVHVQARRSHLDGDPPVRDLRLGTVPDGQRLQRLTGVGLGCLDGEHGGKPSPISGRRRRSALLPSTGHRLLARSGGASRAPRPCWCRWDDRPPRVCLLNDRPGRCCSGVLQIPGLCGMLSESARDPGGRVDVAAVPHEVQDFHSGFADGSIPRPDATACGRETSAAFGGSVWGRGDLRPLWGRHCPRHPVPVPDTVRRDRGAGSLSGSGETRPCDRARPPAERIVYPPMRYPAS